MATQIEENVEPFKRVRWKDVEFEDKIFRLYHIIQMHKNKFTEQPKMTSWWPRWKWKLFPFTLNELNFN